MSQTEVGSLTVARAGLSAILKRSESTIRRQQSESLHLLPPAVSGTKPRIWRVEAVLRWMAEKEGLGSEVSAPPHQAAVVSQEPQQIVKRGRGRPRSPIRRKGMGGAV
jgi:hypothetical protein